MEDAFIFTVDGRGERETAGVFVVEGGRIRRVFDVLVNAPLEESEHIGKQEAEGLKELCKEINKSSECSKARR